MTHATVPAYIAAAPPEQQPALRELRALRALLRRHLPGAREEMSPNGFPVYVVGPDGAWAAGFGSRKKGPVLYVMRSKLVDRFDERLGALRSGRSCIEWRAARCLSLDGLRALAAELLGEVARGS